MIMKNSRGGDDDGGGEEIVQVQGGHILRSTGRKNRHSKVSTGKGPRDRRVRLSAHTAIQFYDVQDRLGYDRPSKAVDWLMKKAQNAIDNLAELPPWNHPIGAPGLSEMTILGNQSDPSSGYGFQVNNNQLGENPGAVPSFHAPPSMGPQPIPDPMKSFFPMTSEMNFHEMMGRNTVQSQHLCLSLHPSTDQGPTLFPATFEEANLLAPRWDGGGTGENRGGGYIFSSQQQFLGQSSVVSQQRGALQYNCVWNQLPIQQSSSIFGGQFGSHQGFLQFQSEEAQHGGGVGSNEPSSSASPNSHH